MHMKNLGSERQICILCNILVVRSLAVELSSVQEYHTPLNTADSFVYRVLRYPILVGCFLAALIVIIFGCQREEPTTKSDPVEPTPTAVEKPDGPPWFEDVTDKVGLNFVHDPGADLSKYLL